MKRVNYIKQPLVGRLSYNLSNGLQSMVELDHSYSIKINKIVHREGICRFFSVISKMGDGPLWIAIIALLPLVYGMDGLKAFAYLIAYVTIAATSYKLIKQFTTRPRPFVSHSEIKLGCPPLDQWSFPSGHTLHAVGITIMLCHFFPAIGVLFIPFALLVAASRVILGLHYVSDVLMGAALAVIISSALLSI